RDGVDPLPVDQDLAGGEWQQAGKAVERVRITATRRYEQGDELARPDRHGQPLQGGAVAEAPADLHQLQRLERLGGDRHRDPFLREWSAGGPAGPDVRVLGRRGETGRMPTGEGRSRGPRAEAEWCGWHDDALPESPVTSFTIRAHTCSVRVKGQGPSGAARDVGPCDGRK